MTYIARESYFRGPDGTITTEPGEGRVMVAVCGAVMSHAEARDRGLLPPQPQAELKPEPSDPTSEEIQ